MFIILRSFFLLLSECPHLRRRLPYGVGWMRSHLRNARIGPSNFLPLIAIIIAFLSIPALVLAGAQERLVVKTAKNDQVFLVEIVNTPDERSMGLMHRRALAANAGMLFDFMKTAPVSMWMKDTLIPLDMLFIRPDGVIANIAERTVPGSLTPIDSHGPVLGVLELNGGASARLHIKPGDRIIHPLFGATQ